MACKTSLSAAAFLFLFAPILPASERYEASEPHMGSMARIILYADSEEQAQRAFLAAFRRIAELNRILSDYDPQSELSRFCESNEPLSPDLATVLAYAQDLAVETGGVFDITAGPLTRLWRKARVPATGHIQEALNRSGYRKLHLTGRRCDVPGMQLDAGGIAKGYAADQALAAVAQAGIRSALVALSGDIVVSQAPPEKPGWKVQSAGETHTLSNAAISTSGDEFQFFEVEGVRYSHIVDPRTGWALKNSRTVSVIARSGMEADALATAVSVAPELADSLRTRHKARIATK